MQEQLAANLHAAVRCACHAQINSNAFHSKPFSLRFVPAQVPQSKQLNLELLNLTFDNCFAMAELATPSELNTLTDLQSLVVFSGLKAEVWNLASCALGEVPNVRILALMPADVIRNMLPVLKVPLPPAPDGTVLLRELTAVEMVQIAMIWRLARAKSSLPDVDILAPSSPSIAAGASGTVVSVPPAATPKKVKASNVIDQSDESEIKQLTNTELRQFFRNHVEVTGAEPLPDSEPTPDQISALHEKIVIRDEEPYADFSILTPFGRRVQKTLRARSWNLQPDGTYKSVDIPGPPSFDSWHACFRVFKAILHMLRYPASPLAPQGSLVVSAASIELYYESFRKLVQEFPEAWHLMMAAEDRCRGEHFSRLRRQLERAYAAGNVPFGLTFDPAMPWDCVFRAAALDARYWDEEVRRPATTFVARGGRGLLSSPIPSAAAESLKQVEEAAGFVASVDKHSPVPRPPGMGQSAHARSKRKLKDVIAAAGAASISSGASSSAKGAGRHSVEQNHPRKQGSLYVTNQDGVQLCFAFAKGGCSEPCPNKRSHSCQLCLGTHRNSECSRPWAGGKGKK